MINKVKSVALLILIRASSMLSMALAMLVIWWKSGIEYVGIFSAVTAIITPIIAFSQYRYVEYISLQEDKFTAFLRALLSSSFTYILLSFIILSVYIAIYGNSTFVILMCIYKLFELFTDIYVAYLSVIQQKNKLQIVILRRVVSILLGFFMLIILNNNFSIGIFTYIPVILSTVFVFFSLLEIFEISKDYSKISFKQVYLYIVNNISYAISSVAVSFNSLLPRYFFVLTGDNKALGMYSLIYLFSANLVTLLQYPISIKAKRIAKFFIDKDRFFILFNSGLISLTFTICFFYNNNYEHNYILYISFGLLILVALTIRAMALSTLVVFEAKSKVIKSLILSSLISLLVILMLNFLQVRQFSLNDAILYTVMSGGICTYLTYFYLKQIKKVKNGTS